MKKIYWWIKTNKMLTGVVGAIFLLIVLNLILMAQFISVLNTFII